MSYIDYNQKLESLHYYIKSQSACTTKDLCGKLDVSRRTIMRMIENLRLMGTKVEYCKRRKVYYLKT